MKIEEELRIKGKVIPHKPMRELTSLRIGGTADFFVIPEDLEDLKKVLTFCRKEGLPMFIIGNGTKLLVRDEGFRGVVIKLGGSFKKIESNGSKIKVGAGVDLSTLINFTVERSLSGLECLVGIPGTVGGAVVRNAGAFGECLSDKILSAKVITEDNGNLTFLRKEMKFGYRTSTFWENKNLVVVEVSLELTPGKKERILSRMKEAKRRKASTQPLSIPSAGCVFKNPPSFSAGFLIQQAGCAGMRIGDAEVSPQHSNFIVNRGKATAKDMLELIKEVQGRVKDKFGITLETELEII